MDTIWKLTTIAFVILCILSCKSIGAIKIIGISKINHISRSHNFVLVPFLEPKYSNLLLRSSPESDNLSERTFAPQKAKRQTFSQGMTYLLSGKGWNGKAIVTKESMAKFGVNCLLAYGFVSNFSYITCVIIAWIAHGKKYHLSPLAPGQWKQFLLIYSGLWVANNIIRPARFSLSLVLSPFFDRGIRRLEESLKLNRVKSTSLMVFLVNFCGTISYLVFGLLAATRLANVPLLP